MSELLIRPIEPSDAAGLHALNVDPTVMPGTAGYPSLPITRIQKQLAERDDLTRHLLGGFIGAEMVGIVGLSVNTHPRTRHGGTLWIGVRGAHQRSGHGRKLMAAMLDLADNYLGLHRIQLEVNHDNGNAIALYESVGFVVEGRLRQNILRGGEYIDSLVMARIRG